MTHEPETWTKVDLTKGRCACHADLVVYANLLWELGHRETFTFAKVTLPALQKHVVIIFYVFTWGFGIEEQREFLVNFQRSPLPGKQSTKSPQIIRERSEENSGEYSGRKFEKLRSFRSATFSDLSKV